ncbi:MAG: PQQ-binding-like beta-propeller repeat protein [Pirellulaceae bacterium]|nr:PQQ-binding-like beta-propeller repeat protein [Pirellulaceae bacterium]
MRWCLLIGLLAWPVLAGCSPDAPLAAAPPVAAGQSPPAAPSAPAVAAPAMMPPAAPLPKSLWTRQAGSDWPAFLGPTGDSQSTETGILTQWPPTGPKLRWHAPLGTSYGAPTISRGRLFQFDRFGDVARLYCLNAETGVPLWKYEYPTDYADLYGYNNGPRCSPVVDDDRVYAFGVDGVLVCCRAESGEKVWQLNTNKAFGVVQNFFGVGSTPVIEGNLLICMIGGSTPESLAVPPGQLDRVFGNGTAVVAFDKFTGEVKYKLSDELASYASMKLATIGGRRWGFAFCRGGLVGFDPATGKVDFEYPWRASILESVNASMPVVVGDEVLISETYGVGSSLLKVSPGKHEVIWRDDAKKRAKAMMTHWNTPVYRDGYLYGSSGRHPENAELRCIEWQTGKVMWSEPGLSRSSLLYIDGHFLCMGEYGQLTLFKVNPEKYEPVAQIDYADPVLGGKLLGGPDVPLLKPYCWAAPIVSHGLLYLRGDGRLACFELIPPR